MFITINSVDWAGRVNKTCILKCLGPSALFIILIFPCNTLYATVLIFIFPSQSEKLIYA